MLISIEKDLATLKNYLQSKGYQIVNAGEGIISDIYIYSQSKNCLGQFKNCVSPGTYGSLMINADNMSLSEIEYALNHRTYTPIFD